MKFKKNSKPNSRGVLLLISAFSASLMLGGCASRGIEPLARNLPATPAFAKTVSVPDPKAGESAIAVAARERAGRKRANTTILNFRKWYGGVREAYGNQR
ncbi:hypothetical protein NWI01_17800 [Nitrobacter winogradskyi]|uniref:Lipoprotein n=1 Tax=Nitrobacter winogradskyi TaxID=913 RepID=A0A4Y3WBP6_NITWI|nr:hypothetical protein NWI01_17800 [Nitrobacter winogradskyi]